MCVMNRRLRAAKVLWHFTMSLDGFVAGPEHDMHWLTAASPSDPA